MNDIAPPGLANVAPMSVAGNRLTLLAEGPERLEALIGLIDGARDSLRLLYYIWRDDAAGRRVRDALIAAAERGVRVWVLVDGFGVSDTASDFFRPLEESRARFCQFEPRWGRRYLLRNHQKLAMADEQRVIIGGFNIADDYFATPEEGGWRDLGLLVEGDSVAGLTRYFDTLFGWASNSKGRLRTLRKLLQRSSAGGGSLHWLFGGLTRRLSPWARAVRQDMKQARSMDVIAGYFAPGPALLRQTASVARRGEARIILPARTDHQVAVDAARHSYTVLLRRGVRVFEYQRAKLHSKLFVLDDIVHIGSANFDMRSLFLNLEMMLRVEDREFAAAMRRYVDGEVADSEEVTLEAHKARRSWLNRLRWAVAYFVMAVADYRITRGLNSSVRD